MKKILVELSRKKKISKVIIIRGRYIPESLLRSLKIIYNVEIVHYQWDSIKNNPNAITISKYATVNYTFDRSDSDKYSTFNYLPLFYNWRGIRLNHFPIRYDVLFVSSWSYERFEILDDFIKLCEMNNLSTYIYIYMPFQTYVKRKLMGNKIPSMKYIHFFTLPKQKYYELMQASNIIFDSPSKKQTGLSMRTIETLSLGKKLLTTNQFIISDPLYNPEFIKIWPITGEQLKQYLYKIIHYKCSNIYSLHEWTSALLS